MHMMFLALSVLETYLAMSLSLFPQSYYDCMTLISYCKKNNNVMSSPELLVIKKEQAANKNLAFCERNNTNEKRNCDGETECVKPAPIQSSQCVSQSVSVQTFPMGEKEVTAARCPR